MPRLGLRAAGFARVRGQVRKRLARRAAELGLADAVAYRRLLEVDPAEWRHVQEAAQITISRVWRDGAQWQAVARYLQDHVERLGPCLRVWSAGCAGGEEPYSWTLLWRHHLQPLRPQLRLEVVATDARPERLGRAKQAHYQAGTLREVPATMRAESFQAEGGGYRCDPELTRLVRFVRQDLRAEAPDGEFDAISCRNLAFTYFDAKGQRAVVARLQRALRPGGMLWLGRGEHLPEASSAFEALPHVPQAYVVRPHT